MSFTDMGHLVWTFMETFEDNLLEGIAMWVMKTADYGTKIRSNQVLCHFSCGFPNIQNVRNLAKGYRHFKEQTLPSFI